MRPWAGAAAVALRFVVAAPWPASAQVNPRGTAELVLGNRKLTLEYGRPSWRNRDRLAEAAPGADWRLGADRATTLKTTGVMSFGTINVRRGHYMLTATKGADGRWSLNFHNPQPGAPRSPGVKVATIPLELSNVDEHIETLTITLEGERGRGELRIRWGRHLLRAPFALE